MDTTLTVGICGAALSILIGGILYARRKSIGLPELFMLSVGLYFGAYSIIDSLVNDLDTFDASIVLLLFAGIVVASVPILYIPQFLPARISAQLRLDRIREDWLRVPTALVLGVVATVVAYRVYTFVFFSEFRELEEQALEKIEVSLPYWYTTLGLIAQSVAFAVTPVAFAKLLESHGKTKVLWWVVIASLLVLTLGFGRRALIAILIMFLWLMLVHYRTSWQRSKIILVCIAFAPALLLLNNVYQGYRLASHRGVVLTNLDTEDVQAVLTGQTILSVALDFDRTLGNLEERTAMWQFNYQLLDSALNRQVDYSYGALLLGEAANFVPRIVHPEKRLFDVDAETSRAFGIEERDWPSNIFAFAFADFGVLSIIAVPLMMTLFLCIFCYVQAAINDVFLRVVLSGFVISYLLNLEVTYSVPIQLARDLLFVVLIYGTSRFLAGIFVARPRTLPRA